MTEINHNFSLILEAANDLHQILYNLQNSGDVDEYEASLLTGEADIFREKIIEKIEKWQKGKALSN